MGMMMNLRRSQMMVTDKDYIPFVDPVVAQICAANWGDGIGITYKQAAKVTSIGTVFKSNTAIMSFDEFEYFTGLTTIGNSTFEGCSSLASITLPESVTTIGDYAFTRCASLTNITLPESVTTIRRGGFYNCSNLASITLPESVTTIGAVVFARCTSLASITLPESVTTIGDHAFEICSRLESVYCKPTTPPTLDINVFRYDSALQGIYVPDASVDAYKAATNWATYADKIKPLSEYTE